MSQPTRAMCPPYGPIDQIGPYISIPVKAELLPNN